MNSLTLRPPPNFVLEEFPGGRRGGPFAPAPTVDSIYGQQNIIAGSAEHLNYHALIPWSQTRGDNGIDLIQPNKPWRQSTEVDLGANCANRYVGRILSNLSVAGGAV